ncbi:hypothetical protein ACHAWT_007773 [Skeletonema menzelii]|eukprot:scaffold26727_cov215-Skeletonema_menzelii.AAC.1
MYRYYILAASAAISSAFITPMTSITFSTPLYQSSSSDDNSDSVNIALIQSDNGQQFSTEGLEDALKSHPFCKMTGVTLSLSTISVASELTKQDVSCLQQSDIACFSNVKGVKSYLSLLDDHFNVAEDISDEDRRSLPNKPDLVGDIIQGISGAVNEEDASIIPDAGIMAACPNTNTARECLNSGRWMSNHIYYPKDTQQAVELKTEEIGSGEDTADEEGENEDPVDLEVWAASIVQAAGDVYERKFWGGGW